MSLYYQDGQVSVYHGDLREIPEWLTADVLVTDPPYGMNLRSNMKGAFGKSVVRGDEDTLARDDALALWGTEKSALVFGRWSVPRPQGTRMVLTWEKGNHVGMGNLRIPWKPNTEEIYVVGPLCGLTGKRTSSVLRHLAIAGTVGRAQDGTRSHPTQKPEGLMLDLVSKTLGVVADPFLGSGTTAVAAKRLGRRCIAVEAEEQYCEVAAKRLAQEVLFVEPLPGPELVYA